MSNWIRFHDEIRRGKHRGIPRALRFVFLELCLEARPGRGVVELPLGMTVLEGVHDLLGGSRREVAAALEVYTAGPGDAPSIRIEGAEGALRLVIPSWLEWNPVDLSADRMRRLREKRALSQPCDASQPVTVTPPDQRREKKRRSEIPPSPPPGDEPAGQVGIAGIAPEPPAKGNRRRPRQDMSRRPESWAPNDGHFKLGATVGLDQAAVLAEVGPWSDFHTGAGTMIADFDGSFRTWIRNAPKFRRSGGRASPGASTVQQPARPGEHRWRPGEEIS